MRRLSSQRIESPPIDSPSGSEVEFGGSNGLRGEPAPRRLVALQGGPQDVVGIPSGPRDGVATPAKPRDDQWLNGFDCLESYLALHGHASPTPTESLADFPIGRWVRIQRMRFSKGQMSAEQRRKLEAIGFVWKPHVAAWTEGFRRLREYRQRAGNCRVKADHVERGFPLGAWVRYHRQRWRQGALPVERILGLRSLGFVLEPHESKWEDGFSYLQEFRAGAGNCEVPAIHQSPDGYRLGQWVSAQRAAMRDGRLSEERAHRLADVGFTWRRRNRTFRRERPDAGAPPPATIPARRMAGGGPG